MSWLPVIFNRAATPERRTIQGPARPGRVPIVPIEHCQIDTGTIRAARVDLGEA